MNNHTSRFSPRHADDEEKEVPEEATTTKPEEDVNLEERRNRSCIFLNDDPNVWAYLGDRKLVDEEEEFPPDTELVFRCIDIGKFNLIGSVRRRCEYGYWTGIKATCIGLSQEHDYARKSATLTDFSFQRALGNHP